MRFFHVGCIVAVCTKHNGILTCGSNDLELFAQVSADGTAVGRDCAVLQTKSIKNSTVRLSHVLITGFGILHVFIKTISILHEKFTPPHETKSRTTLISEFNLNLIKVLWQLFVAFEFLPCKIGDHLLAGGLNDKIPVVTVLDP